ncbi:hypothetical protein [Escherichia phage vB_EcoM-LTH01]
MKVSELIEELQKCRPDDKVSIPVEVGHVTIGGTPRREVEAVYRGFDWDSKQVFLHICADERLTVMSKEEYIELIRYKQLVSGMRGKQDIEHLSDVFVKKDFVIERLQRLSHVEELETFEISNLISEIIEEKL